MLLINSPDFKPVFRYAMKKSSNGNSRWLPLEKRVNVASSAIRHGNVSPMGDAVPIFPPMVPTFLICREPIRVIKVAKEG